MPDNAKSASGDFGDISDDLNRIDREFRKEAATDEELAELQRQRRLTLGAVLETSMHRGDRIAFQIADLRREGFIAAVGDDYCTIRVDEIEMDIRVSEMTFQILRSRAGGASGRPASATFKARVSEHEQVGARVQVLTRNGAEHSGRLSVVGPDHLRLVNDRVESVVPLELVVAVISSLR